MIKKFAAWLGLAVAGVAIVVLAVALVRKVSAQH